MILVLRYGESRLLRVKTLAAEWSKISDSDADNKLKEGFYVPVGVHITPGFAEKPPDGQSIAHIKTLRDQYFRSRKFTIC
jgi:hypothetical protein